jgi:hypothetical protein
MIQTGPNKQIRYDNGPDVPKSIAFNLAPKDWKPEEKTTSGPVIKNTGLSRNDKINVEYANGVRFFGVKFKKVEADLNKGLCKIIDESLQDTDIKSES